ncbi:CGNR zinc finger domain-containing protein [Gryllotalpicola koreensis]|uniref:CGNR zinc finger domain-containing protein n=1 Tax=Gryllotalpicola koreensis TaxID=993086 RepID=A0ABP8A7D9_9MICO
MTTFRSGNGAAWLDLLSTREGRYRDASRYRDRIDTPDALHEWLRQNGLEPARYPTATDVELFAVTREALHRVTVQALHGEAASPADAHAVAEALSADRGLEIERGDAGLRIRRPDSAQEALARLTRTAVEDLTGPHVAQLHACGDDTCAGVFLDPTGRRRWCTDQSCGNRLRVRAHRERTRQTSGA